MNPAQRFSQQEIYEQIFSQIYEDFMYETQNVETDAEDQTSSTQKTGETLSGLMSLDFRCDFQMVRIWRKRHESMDPSCLVSTVQAGGSS